MPKRIKHTPAERLALRNKARATARRLAAPPIAPDKLAHRKAVALTWRRSNREHLNQTRRARYRRNLVQRRREASLYAKSHRTQINDAKKRRRKSHPELRILDNLRDRLTELMAPGSQRPTRTSSLTGCTRQTLRSHLESKFLPGMGWYNYGTAWHVDHITPCSSFDLTDKESRHACFHYTNLQPLWDTVNIEKGDSLTYDTGYAIAMTPYPS